MKIKHVTFDIETGPQPASYLLDTFEPQFEPDKIEEFKPDSRLKDPEKIADNLALVKEKNQKRLQEMEASVARKRMEWIDDSALYGERAQILAIGWKATDGGWGELHWNHPAGSGIFCDGNPEVLMLDVFWGNLTYYIEQGYTVSGFNLIGFDLRMIRQRMLIHGMKCPYYNHADKWNPWRFPIFDAMLNWQSGDNRTNISLDKLSRALGVGKKTGNGAKFHELYAENPDKALEYLRNDVDITHRDCDKMMEVL